MFHVDSGKLTDSKYANAVNQAAADMAKTAHVASVVNPLTPEGASALSKSQATGYLSVTTSVSPGSLSVDDAQKIVDAAAEPAERRRGSRSRPAACSARRSPSRRRSPAS